MNRDIYWIATPRKTQMTENSLANQQKLDERIHTQ